MKRAAHIVHSKFVQRLRNLNLLRGIEEGICELLALAQGTLDDLKPRYIAKEVGHGLVVPIGIPRRVWMWVLTCPYSGIALVRWQA